MQKMMYSIQADVMLNMTKPHMSRVIWAKQPKNEKSDVWFIIDGMTAYRVFRSDLAISEDWLLKNCGAPANIDGLLSGYHERASEYIPLQKTGYKLIDGGKRQLAMYSCSKFTSYVNEKLYSRYFKNDNFTFWAKDEKSPIMVMFYDDVVGIVIPVRL